MSRQSTDEIRRIVANLDLQCQRVVGLLDGCVERLSHPAHGDADALRRAEDVIDREDARIHAVLENAKRELLAVRGPALPRRTLRPRNSIRPGASVIQQQAPASVAA